MSARCAVRKTDLTTSNGNVLAPYAVCRQPFPGLFRSRRLDKSASHSALSVESPVLERLQSLDQFSPCDSSHVSARPSISSRLVMPDAHLATPSDEHVCPDPGTTSSCAATH